MFLWIFALVLMQQPSGSFLLQGGTVHTVSGAAIENGSVLVRDGKIIGVGKNLTAPEGVRVIDIAGQHVYPGMIDGASLIGLEKDKHEMGLLNPQLKAAVAVNPDAAHIPGARANGVTSVIEFPEGELLAGQMSLIHMDGGSNDAMNVIASTAIHLRFPAIVTMPPPPHEPEDDDTEPIDIEPIPYGQAKADYELKKQTLVKFFDDARRYRQRKLAKAKGLEIDRRFEIDRLDHRVRIAFDVNDLADGFLAEHRTLLDLARAQTPALSPFTVESLAAPAKPKAVEAVKPTPAAATRPAAKRTKRAAATA